MASTELTLRTRAEIFSSSGCASFRNVALLVSKNASPLTVTVRIGFVCGAAAAAAGTAARAAAAGAADDVEAGAGAAAAGAGWGDGGEITATGAGFALPQPTMFLSVFHWEVRTQLPYVSMTTRPSDGAPRNASVGSWFSWAKAEKLSARLLAT